VTTPVDTDAQARGILADSRDDRIELTVPGTDYRLAFVPGAPVRTPAGKRVRGTVHAQALRMHAARGGGRFIEPVQGEPRIVAGTIAAVDEPNRRVLLETAVPMWVTWQEGQDLSILRVGQLVNCYVRSGARFEPA
jgi:hypothetical protein